MKPSVRYVGQRYYDTRVVFGVVRAEGIACRRLYAPESTASKVCGCSVRHSPKRLQEECQGYAPLSRSTATVMISKNVILAIALVGLNIGVLTWFVIIHAAFYFHLVQLLTVCCQVQERPLQA